MKKIIYFLFLCSFFEISAQGEANNWFFGQNASLNFNQTPPKSETGQLSTNEGCSSFSDSNGNLLFYSDGTTVWDKNHAIMPNGNNLKGHPSSTQSAIIIPKPNSANMYYLFTVGARIKDSGEFGFHYYTIDMTANNGNGAIIAGPVNLGGSDNPEWSEKVTSVKGDDCNSFWVISLVYNLFYAYKVDATGVANTPVISRVDYNSTDVSRRGYLKVSPDGTMLACATFAFNGNQGGPQNGKLHLYNFDAKSGTILNDATLLISNVSNDGEPYGIEFSPNSTFLYASTMGSKYHKLFQFDLKEQDIAGSKTLIDSQVGYRGALQLAPNGKIYATVPPSYTDGTHFLNIIHNPEGKGTACNYEINGLDLSPNYAMQGLPPFIASLLLPIKITELSNPTINLNNTIKGTCIGESLSISSEIIDGEAIYQWYFNGEPYTSGFSLDIQNIQLSNAGLYELNVQTVDECGFNKTYKGSIIIKVYKNPVAKNSTYDQCDFDNKPLNGKTIFNLSLKKESITSADDNLSVYFYKDQMHYNNDNFIKDETNFINTIPFSQTLLTKIINNSTNCYSQGSLTLNISPTSLATYPNVYLCENDLNAADTVLVQSNGAGVSSYDFEDKKTEIQSLFNPVSVNVAIYKNSIDAQTQTYPIKGIHKIASHLYYVRIENVATKSCVAVGTFKTILNYLPTVSFSKKEILLCVNNPLDTPHTNTILLRTQFGKTIAYFKWYLNGKELLGARKSKYEATKKGTYFVEAHKYYLNDTDSNADDTYCIGYSSIQVNTSNPAAIKDSHLNIVEDSSNNTLNIINTNTLGLGDYEFGLNLLQNDTEYQEHTNFEYLSPGFHTLYIRDKNGCGTSTKKFAILAYPKFFTPNNDGINDTWKLIGLDRTKYRSANLQIFNRYGKLIKQMNLTNNSWDGSYNGKLLKSDDYWFVVKLTDLNTMTIIKKGHFSLLRN